MNASDEHHQLRAGLNTGRFIELDAEQTRMFFISCITRSLIGKAHIFCGGQYRSKGK